VEQHAQLHYGVLAVPPKYPIARVLAGHYRILNFVAVDNQALKYVDNPIEDVYGMNREQMNS